MTEIRVTADLLVDGATLIPLSGKIPISNVWQTHTYFRAEARSALIRGHRGNLGFPTGMNRVEMPDGTFTGVQILDEDVKPGQKGRETLARLEQELGPLPPTLTVRTASGGRHFYFEALPELERVSPKPFVSDFGKDAGLDFLRNGQQAVFPGSELPSGKYEWLDTSVPVARLPDGWVQYLKLHVKHIHTSVREDAPEPVDVTTENGKGLVLEGIEWCEKEAPVAVKGNRGQDDCLRVAAHLVKVLRLPLDVAKDIMVHHWAPRCDPPNAWSDWNLTRKLEQARDVVEFPAWGLPISEESARAIWAPGRARRRGVVNETPTSAAPPEEWPFYNSFVPGQSNSSTSEEPKAALPVDVANVLATHPHWLSKTGTRCLRWNTFNNRLVAFYPPVKLDAQQGKVSDADVARVRMWLSCNGKVSLKEDTMDAMNEAAKRSPFHPILDYLKSCQNTHPDILDDLAAVVFGSPEPLAQEFLKKTLVASVRRILKPGTRVDTVLTLMGKQGAKKTTFVQALYGEEYVRSQMPDLSNKDASIALQDFWAVELGELHKTLKTDHGTVKEFLSRTYDDFRPPHGRNDIRMPRHNIFIGTVNEDTFLSDATGNRRFWPVAVQKVDIEFVLRNRDVIWAAAVALERAGYCHWFEDESLVEPAHEAFIVQDPWHDIILTYVQGQKRVTNEEVFKFAICADVENVDMSKYTKGAQMQIADTLKRLGCKRGNDRPISWTVPPNLASKPKQSEETSLEKPKNRYS